MDPLDAPPITADPDLTEPVPIEPAPVPPALPQPAPVEPIRLDLSRIAQDLQIRRVQVESVVQLLEDGNTVPFITRYRKERTGGLDEEMIRRIQFRVAQLRRLADRKQSILRTIDSQGKLTDDLRAAILTAEHPKRLEDIYQPFKPKKRTLAAEARERGLEPLALAIWNRDPVADNLPEILAGLIDPDKQLATVDDITAGVRNILAELVADTADVRSVLRLVLWDTGRLTSVKNETVPEGKGLEYKDYFQFTEPIGHMPPHRILALNRGERENVLKVKLEFDMDLVRSVTGDRLPIADHPHFDFIVPAIEDGLTRLVLPSLEREIRRDLTERSQDHAIEVFARNLRSLLLQPPLRATRVLAIDPGFRTGCKLAVLDETGNPLDDAVIYPHAPQKKLLEAKVKLEELVRRYQIHVIAIGNGTACRDTEEFVAGLIAELDARRRGELPPPLPPMAPATVAVAPPPLSEPPPELQLTWEVATALTPPPLPQQPPPLPPPPPPVVDPSLPEAPEDLAYVIVNEAGASDYSASPQGREEFPNLDATLRGTISIGRRLQDPLSELVKIDPQHVGVGLYQHDVHAKHLKESLGDVIESCVNHVGVDLNTASVPLLRHIAGFNQHVARELIDYRTQHGPFQRREQLKEVPGVGEARFTQAAGFLMIRGGDEPLDVTWIHPESYPAARQLLADLEFEPASLPELKPDHPLHEKLKAIAPAQAAERLQLGVPTVADILEALAKPGRDPREDLSPPIFKKGVLKLEDLHAGMELKGTVLNVVDFGAFIDVGLKDSGLVHISQMANRYIKNPHEVAAVGDVVTAWVMAVDAERRRVSLTMIPPGTERKPAERRPQRQERPQGDRPPRGDQQQQRGDRPPRRGPRRQGPPQSRPGSEAPPEGPQQPRAPRQLPPRKPPKPRPLPTLTQAKKEGKEKLNTFGELEAFFKTRETPATEIPPPEAPPPEASGESASQP